MPWRDVMYVCAGGCRYVGAHPTTFSGGVKAVQHFEGPDERVKQMYCDGAPELKRALLDVGIINPTSTPGCPATNGIAEACVKDSKNGTRCAHIQAGFEASWWERAATCYSFHTNIIHFIPILLLVRAGGEIQRPVRMNAVTLRSVKHSLSLMVLSLTLCLCRFLKTLLPLRRTRHPRFNGGPRSSSWWCLGW
jgi:hypothetical protein